MSLGRASLAVYRRHGQDKYISFKDILENNVPGIKGEDFVAELNEFLSGTVFTQSVGEYVNHLASVNRSLLQNVISSSFGLIEVWFKTSFNEAFQRRPRYIRFVQ
jgi:hypothetical protein